MRKPQRIFCLAVSFSLLVLAGCVSKPTMADLMREYASEVQAQVDLKEQLARDWEEGTKLISSGDKRIKNGEKQVKSAENRIKAAERDLKRGQAEIERGKREIAEGQQMIQESEKTFVENFPEMDINAGR